MHGGVLPEVKTDEMKTETVDRPAQPTQTPACEDGGAIGAQRGVNDIKIGSQFHRVRIGWRLGGMPAQRVCNAELACCSGKPRVEPDNRLAIRLERPVRRGVRRLFGQRVKRRRGFDNMPAERQFAAKLMQFSKQKAQRAVAVAAQRFAQHVGGDKRIAVTVAADPGSHDEEGRQLDLLAFRLAPLQFVLKRAVQTRHFRQKRIVVIGHAVIDFVEYAELGAAQQVCLPQRQHDALQLFLALRLLLRRLLHAFALAQNVGDFHFAGQRALAPHFRRMRGEHRADQRRLEQRLDFAKRVSILDRVVDGVAQRAGARRRAQHQMSAVAADMVLVLGNIGEVGEIAEGADNLRAPGVRQAVKDCHQFGASARIFIAVEAYGGLADALDRLVDRLALLLAHRVAEQAPEQADVLAQGQVLVAEILVIQTLAVEGGVVASQRHINHRSAARDLALAKLPGRLFCGCNAQFMPEMQAARRRRQPTSFGSSAWLLCRIAARSAGPSRLSSSMTLLECTSVMALAGTVNSPKFSTYREMPPRETIRTAPMPSAPSDRKAIKPSSTFSIIFSSL